ncbi:erbin-like isoform X3 [Mizuhopecten yessoensis]|uniref:erbin-like isoform X3 n=1 Tax=Mizuhopecten yessoensis TaxID=6573 RepID=UPI000B45D77F|nr:erbin-like isoform X3 [Mizuhopecten yessoensis]
MAGFVKKCPCLRPQIEEDVRELDYRHCSLTDVPSEVFNFERTLEELFVDSNQIRDLPRELFYCHGIRKLSLSDNEITHIPPAIASLINLEDLDISKNGIIDMPENIKCCKYLHTVEASVNPLGKLPDGFTQLLNLTQLFLNDTFLDYLPGNFGRLSHLKILEIRENHLKTLPKSFSRLGDLERLDIGHNEFTDLPDVIGSLTGLLELWCDHNQIAQVTPMIGNLKQLMFLDCTKNRIQTLPNEIEGCVSLADLHLTGNHLQGLPESMGNLEHITTLKVDANQLTSLPNTIGGLTALSELNVSRNDLEDLPSSLGLLRNLRTLYADENCLEMIPAELGSCSGITVLSLRSNKLEYIPDELGRIPRLRVLNLSDNLLKFLPFSITKLKELQALWLSENQTRPIVPFQSEIEQETGRKILTCYLLPQCPSEDLGDPNGGGDTDSFHASIWDEEREQRQQIHFEFTEELDEDGKLVRCPTPYPKEMREKIRHARNLAVRQKLTGDGRPWRGGEDNKGFDREEKLAKDKARMQQNRHSSPETFVLDLSQSSRRGDSMSAISRPDSPKKGGKLSPRKYKTDEDDGGFSTRDSSKLSHHSSNPDVSVKSVGVSSVGVSTRTTESIGVTAKSSSDQSGPRGMPGFAYVNPKDLEASFSQYSMFGRSVDPTYHNRKSYHSNQHRGGRHRTRDYDSDTGYRSETEVARFHRQQVLTQQQERRGYESERESRAQRRKGRDGYSSDLDCYQSHGGDSRDIAYRGVPLHQQHNANSLPYDLNESQRQLNQMPHKTSNPHLSIKGSDMYLDSMHRMGSDTYKDSQKPMMRNSEHYIDRSMSHPPHSVDRSLPLPSHTVSRTLPPPSPSQFHRSKIVDQSTPTTAEPPPGFPPGGIERSRSNSASGSHDGGDVRVSDQRRDIYNSSNTREYSNRSTPSNQSNGLPPPYKPAPPYVSSPGQKKLPPTPNRNSPYGVLNYDRRGNNSPTMHQKLSGMTIQEQMESKTESDKYADKNRMPGNVDYGRRNATRQLEKDFNYNDRNCSDGLSDSHNDSRTSHDDYKFNYNSDPSTMSASPDRSRTPVSSSFDEHRDSPRESGYSSREHSSHRNSPFDTPQKYDQPPPSGSYIHVPQGSYGDGSEGRVANMSNYEDVNAFENSNSEPTSQVSSSSDSGYYHGQQFDKPAETPSKYSDYSYPQESRYTTSPGQQYPYTPYATPVRASPKSGGTTNPNQSRESRQPIKIIQNDLKGDKFRVTIKKNPGLGFSIAGGYGAHGNPYRAGDKGIFVTKVQSEGPAAMSLSPGDKILEVNGHDFTKIHHDDAVSVIKQCSSVSMNIERVYTV